MVDWYLHALVYDLKAKKKVVNYKFMQPPAIVTQRCKIFS